MFSRGERKPERPGAWPTIATLSAAQRSAVGAIECREDDLPEPNLALVRHVHPGEEREKRRLARAGRPHDDRQLTRKERRVEALERDLPVVAP